MKYIITVLFVLLTITLYSQDIGRRLTTGKVFHTQMGSGVGYFDVEITFTDEGGLFDGTSVAIGDYLFVSDGGFGYYLPITQVLVSGPVTCQVRVSNVGLPIGGISSDLGYVTKGTSKFKFIPYVGGLSNANQQINSEEFISRLDSILKFKLPERTSGSIPPAYTPTSNDSWIAQNAAGDVYKFNGTTWSLVGGLVNTTSPILGNGTSGNAVRLAASGVTPNIYGSATRIPVITADSFGRITLASTAIVADTLTTNEGRLGVGGSGVASRTITTNTSGSNPITILAGTGIDLTGSVGGTNGGTIGIRNTGDLSTSNEGNLSLLPFGSNGGRITSNTSGSGSPKFVGTGNTTITVNNDTLFINSTSGISSVFTSGIITGDGTTGNRIRLDTTGLGDNEYVMTYNGSTWGAGNLFSGSGITGDGTSSTPFQLDDLGATTGQVIKWNGSAWIAANDSFNVIPALGGDLSGTLSSANVIRIRNTPVSTITPTLNQILKFDGTEYVPSVDTFRWALKAPNGSLSAPSYSFDQSQGSGLYAAQGTIPRMFIIGASSTSSTRGTGINLTAGSNSSTGIGGTITMAGGNSASGAAGAINFNGGSASSSGAGGTINMTAGNSTNNNAGNILLNGGFGNFGGGISLVAGLSTGTNQDGPQVNIYGGSAGPNGRGGDIILTPGTGYLDTTRNGRILIINSTGLVLPRNNKNHLTTMPNKLVGQMIYATQDTASNGKIGNVRVWNGTEWLPLYTPENTAASIAEPTNQIVVGTGSGVDSYNRLKYNGYTQINRASRENSVPIHVITTDTSFGTSNYFTPKELNVQGMTRRAWSDPRYGRFGNWREFISWDNSINNTGTQPDTTGNLIYNRGFNMQSDPDYNPKRPSVYESVEWSWRSPGLNKNFWEWHIEAKDTFGRIYRPFSTAHAVDGVGGSTIFSADEFSLLKTPGYGYPDFWESKNYRIGQYTHNNKFNNKVNDNSDGYSLIEKYRKGRFSHQNIIGLPGGNLRDVVQLGDSAGILITNTLRFNVNNQTPRIITTNANLLIDSTLVTINSINNSGIQLGYKTPSSSDVLYTHYDGSWYYLSKNNANSPVWFHKNAPTQGFVLEPDGGLTIGANTVFGGNIQAKLMLANYSSSSAALMRLDNSEGTTFFKRKNSSPENILQGNPGDICYVNNAGVGKLFGKKTGTGNTGWEEYISTPNIANLLTVGSGTDSTSIIQTNVSGASPITLKASKDLSINESGSTITLSSNPDVLEFNGYNSIDFNCYSPSTVPDPLHGPFFAKDTSNECGPVFYQWDHINEQWISWIPFTGNLNIAPSNRLARINSNGNVASSSNLYYAGTGAVYFNVPDVRRTSGRAPYTGQGAMFAYHVNGSQHTEMRIASYGAGFDLHIEDHNQNESYSTYATTYRSSSTPGSYRAPVVGDLMFKELIRITRGNLPADPYNDACGFYPWDVKVASVGASNNVGTEVNFYTRKNTDGQAISGVGNLVLQLKENRDIRAANYASPRNDTGTPIRIAAFNDDGTLRADSLSEFSFAETLGIDTDLGSPDGGILTWNQTAGEWEGIELAQHFEETNYSATAGATSFTIPIAPASPTGSKMPIRVYRNGVKLIYTSGAPNVHQFSYTGSTLTTSACSAGDIISVEYLNY